MWAVVEIGKKQYKIKKGDTVTVERLLVQGGSNSGQKVEGNIILDKVLLFCDNEKVEIGTPYLEGVKAEASVVEEKKSKKVVVYKYHRRKKYRVKTGHRQILTILKISNIIKS